MPDCHLVAVASGSSLDTYTNNWTLFQLTEEIHIHLAPLAPSEETAEEDVSALPGFPIPFELHTFWTFNPSEYDNEYKFRAVFAESHGEGFFPTTPFPLESKTKRLRLRLRNIGVPRAGQFRILVEWKEAEAAEWNRCAPYWPLDISVEYDQDSPT